MGARPGVARRHLLLDQRGSGSPRSHSPYPRVRRAAGHGGAASPARGVRRLAAAAARGGADRNAGPRPGWIRGRSVSSHHRLFVARGRAFCLAPGEPSGARGAGRRLRAVDRAPSPAGPLRGLAQSSLVRSFRAGATASRARALLSLAGCHDSPLLRARDDRARSGPHPVRQAPDWIFSSRLLAGGPPA
jgi:hypothetical protein